CVAADNANVVRSPVGTDSFRQGQYLGETHVLVRERDDFAPWRTQDDNALVREPEHDEGIVIESIVLLTQHFLCLSQCEAFDIDRINQWESSYAVDVDKV